MSKTAKPTVESSEEVTPLQVIKLSALEEPSSGTATTEPEEVPVSGPEPEILEEEEPEEVPTNKPIMVVVNGRARSGKDTLVGLMRSYLRANGINSAEYSTIQIAKDFTDRAGIDTSAKTEADRELWAVIGDAVEKHSRLRSITSANNTTDLFESQQGRAVMFLHVREQLVASRIQELVQERVPDALYVAILLESNVRGEDVQSNSSDAGIYKMKYDHTLENNGTIQELQVKAEELLAKIIEGRFL